MNLHDWIDELCDVLDIEVDLDDALVLDLAKEIAHNVERPAAPLSTFLLGYAAAQHAGAPDEVERLVAVATDLAVRWDRPADEVEHEDDDPEIDTDLPLEDADA